jgi:RNA polymerase sigma-70 factor (ECF subfamily)
MREEHPISLTTHNGQFNTTHWSVVLMAGGGQSAQSLEALETLCRTYWRPLYAFARRKGHSEEDARDLTQKFFAFILQRNDLGTVAAHKGKFRTFLLTAMTHFLSNERDYAHATKRGGGRELLSIDQLETEGNYEIPQASELSPDRLFDQRWALTILERALTHLEKEQMLAGKSAPFVALKAYLTEDPDPGEYSSAATQLGITPQAMAVRVHRMRQRFRDLVRVEIAQTVSNPLELEQEMQHLFQALSDSV